MVKSMSVSNCFQSFFFLICNKYFIRIFFLYAIPYFPYTSVERHRKEKINAGINRIGELLPCSQALKQVNV